MQAYKRNDAKSSSAEVLGGGAGSAGPTSTCDAVWGPATSGLLVRASGTRNEDGLYPGASLLSASLLEVQRGTSN